MKSKLPTCFAISSALREITTSSAPRRKASPFLLGELVKTTVCAPKACANFTPMWPNPPRPTIPTFLPFRHAPVAHGRVSRDPSAQQWRKPGKVKVHRHLQHKARGNHNAFGVATICHARATLVGEVIGQRHVW